VQGGCEQAIIWDFLASASSSLASATQEPPLSQVLDFHLAKISAVAFANETGILATASVDGSIAIWDLALGSRLGFYMVDDAVTSMNWLGKSRSLCACTSTGAVVALRFAA
jgi:WD40 repeat protein